MRAAIIGCGLIAQNHAQAIQALGHTIAVAIDNNPGNAEQFAQNFQSTKHSHKFSDALKDDIQVVHICTPPALHYQMIKEALLASKHVICEKPMCLETNQAKELLQLAVQKNLIHAVNFNVRFYDACQLARNIIQSAAFGNPLLIHGSYLQEFHILPNDYSWRYQPDLAGPMRATTEIGSHWIDLARFLTGLEITEVSANFVNFTPQRYIKDGTMFAESIMDAKKMNVNSEDAAVISLRFSNHAIGSIFLSEVSHGRSNALFIEVTGQNQSVWWHAENPNQLHTGLKAQGTKTETYAFSGAYPFTFSSFFHEVYQQIESPSPEEKKSYATFYDGYVNTAICAAIYESANQNAAWVKVTT
ncbi:MAG: Gfo/Idh/MocA family oxidoreductase [Anaerolineaceae bacterium]|nr:Gfo/Idh/MocA family oxidoreductase [Anaerolineaceae bacterium]